MNGDLPQASQATASRKADEPGRMSVTIDQVKDYEFRVRFEGKDYDDLMVDEPPPLGTDKAPNASRLLAAAVGNCLSASLLFCARKARVEVEGIRTVVNLQYGRNEKGRIRVAHIDVAIEPRFSGSDPDKRQRCLDVFEDYCTVTGSVRHGIDISVSVREPAAPGTASE
jgi:uncharacterized OsmC-like protein